MSTNDIPPPYPGSPPSSPVSQPPGGRALPITTPHLTAHLAAYLHALPARAEAAGSAHRTAQAGRDLELVTLLAAEVEAFLADAAAAYPRPATAELTLVPAAAVPEPWALSGAAERRRDGEMVQLARVPAPAATPWGGDDKGRGRRDGSGGSRDWTTGVMFDEWGRFGDDNGGGGGAAGERPGWWWWRDGAMARRLAGHLNPRAAGERETASRGVEGRAVAETAAKERSAWSWARKKSGEPAPQKVAVERAPVEANEQHGVTMAVRAEEVTFRRENEFGIWEGMTGWGIVVMLRFRRS